MPDERIQFAVLTFDMLNTHYAFVHEYVRYLNTRRSIAPISAWLR